MSRSRSVLMFLVLILVLSSLATVSGCSKADERESAAPREGSQTDSEQGGGQEEAVKVLALGKKGSNQLVSEVAVTKVTATKSLTSPEATELLQVGAPGESPELAEKQPKAGNEFLMVTFTYKSKKKLVGIHPVDVKLEDSKGKQYEEVSTSGHGGIYNQDPPEAGAEARVTAVYEVPAGAEGLTLTYQPFGDRELTFKIR